MPPNHKKRGKRGKGKGGASAAKAPKPEGDALQFTVRATVDFHESVQTTDIGKYADTLGSEPAGEGANETGIKYKLKSWGDLEDMVRWFGIGCHADNTAQLLFSTLLAKEDRAAVHGMVQDKFPWLQSFAEGIEAERQVSVVGSGFPVPVRELTDAEEMRSDRLYRWAQEAGLNESRDQVKQRVATDKLSDELKALEARKSAEQVHVTSILEAVQSKDLVAVKAAAAEHASALTAGAYEYDSKHAPLHLATSLGLTDIMEALLAAGAPVEALDGFGNTALQVARREEQCDAEGVLLRVAGARDPDADKWPGANKTPELAADAGPAAPDAASGSSAADAKAAAAAAVSAAAAVAGKSETSAESGAEASAPGDASYAEVAKAALGASTDSAAGEGAGATGGGTADHSYAEVAKAALSASKETAPGAGEGGNPAGAGSTAEDHSYAAVAKAAVAGPGERAAPAETGEGPSAASGSAAGDGSYAAVAKAAVADEGAAAVQPANGSEARHGPAAANGAARVQGAAVAMSASAASSGKPPAPAGASSAAAVAASAKSAAKSRETEPLTSLVSSEFPRLVPAPGAGKPAAPTPDAGKPAAAAPAGAGKPDAAKAEPGPPSTGPAGADAKRAAKGGPAEPLTSLVSSEFPRLVPVPTASEPAAPKPEAAGAAAAKPEAAKADDVAAPGAEALAATQGPGKGARTEPLATLVSSEFPRLVPASAPKPDAAKPPTAKLDADKPGAAKLDAANPVAAKPAAAKPAAAAAGSATPGAHAGSEPAAGSKGTAGGSEGSAGAPAVRELPATGRVQGAPASAAAAPADVAAPATAGAEAPAEVKPIAADPASAYKLVDVPSGTLSGAAAKGAADVAGTSGTSGVEGQKPAVRERVVTSEIRPATPDGKRTKTCYSSDEAWPGGNAEDGDFIQETWDAMVQFYADNKTGVLVAGGAILAVGAVLVSGRRR